MARRPGLGAWTGRPSNEFDKLPRTNGSRILGSYTDGIDRRTEIAPRCNRVVGLSALLGAKPRDPSASYQRPVPLVHTSLIRNFSSCNHHPKNLLQRIQHLGSASTCSYGRLISRFHYRAVRHYLASARNFFLARTRGSPLTGNICSFPPIPTATPNLGGKFDTQCSISSPIRKKNHRHCTSHEAKLGPGIAANLSHRAHELRSSCSNPASRDNDSAILLGKVGTDHHHRTQVDIVAHVEDMFSCGRHPETKNCQSPKVPRLPSGNMGRQTRDFSETTPIQAKGRCTRVRARGHGFRSECVRSANISFDAQDRTSDTANDATDLSSCPTVLWRPIHGAFHQTQCHKPANRSRIRRETHPVHDETQDSRGGIKLVSNIYPPGKTGHDVQDSCPNSGIVRKTAAGLTIPLFPPTLSRPPDSYFIDYPDRFGIYLNEEKQVIRLGTELCHTGELADINVSPLNLPALIALDPPLKDVLAPITEHSAFLSLFLNDNFKYSTALTRGTSRKMLRHYDKLLASGVFQAHPLWIPKGVLNLFTVPKKNKSLRVVIDGRKINKLQVKPKDMQLPSILDIIDMLMSNEFCAVADAKAYFYQFPLCDVVSHYFASNLSHNRGSFKTVYCSRLPMGWSHAPRIAQRSSNALCSGLKAKAWIDNFIICGSDLEEFNSFRREFLRRIRIANVTLSDYEMSPSQHFTSLGLSLDLHNKTIQMDPDWILGLENNTATRRLVFKTIGKLIWSNYCRRQPLCLHSSSMELFRRIAREVASGLHWDTATFIFPHEQTDVSHFFSEVKTNAPIHWTAPIPDHERLVAYSDSSDHTIAALRFFQTNAIFARQRTLTPSESSLHIFLKEALAAHMATDQLSNKSLLLHVDNLPLSHAINRGVSSSAFVNALLSNWVLRNLNVKAVWVPSEEQLADPYTRGTPVPIVPVHTSR